MYQLPNIPSSHSNVGELTDFFELESLKEGSCSLRRLQNIINQLEENEENGPDDDEILSARVQDVMQEVGRRENGCREDYPFVISREGNTISLAPPERWNCRKTVYCYLLLATRLNMKKFRVQGNVDGTKVFEILSSEVARCYFGARGHSFVFGTAEDDVVGFENKVKDFCQRIQEGEGFRQANSGPVTAQDGGVDVVVWVPFADKRPGKVIGFGQCKTGVSWRDATSRLQPECFWKKFVNGHLMSPYLRVFFVAEAVEESKWLGYAIEAGVFFDRCRILDFLPEIPDDLYQEILQFTKASVQGNELFRMCELLESV